MVAFFCHAGLPHWPFKATKRKILSLQDALHLDINQVDYISLNKICYFRSKYFSLFSSPCDLNNQLGVTRFQAVKELIYIRQSLPLQAN